LSALQTIITWDADTRWRPSCLTNEPTTVSTLPGVPTSFRGSRVSFTAPDDTTLSELRKRIYAEARTVPGVQFASVTLPHRLESPKEVFVFDMDSTLVKEEGIDELARQHGNYESVALETKKAMSEGTPFKESLRRRLALLRGLSRDKADYVGRNVHFSDGAEPLLTALTAARKHTAIASGGFVELTAAIQARFPQIQIYANRMEWTAEDTLTGKVLGPIIGPTEKAECLKQLCREVDQLTENSVVFGDGANDLLLFASAGFAIGYKSKSVLDGSTDLLILSGPLNATLVKI
jgi:phosphoserine phosphatase